MPRKPGGSSKRSTGIRSSSRPATETVRGLEGSHPCAKGAIHPPSVFSGDMDQNPSNGSAEPPPTARLNITLNPQIGYASPEPTGFGLVIEPKITMKASFVNGQVEVSAGGQMKVSTPCDDS